MPPNDPKAPRKGSRKAFKRTQVPTAERVISTAIVLLIGATGVGIWLKGQRFDPHLYTLRNDALKSTAEAIDSKPDTAPAEPSQSQPKPVAQSAEAESYAEATETGGVAQEALEIPGVKAMDKTEFYSADNLFEKINGRAPAYIGFNFQQLRCRSFSVPGSPESFVDVFEYLMKTPLDAFGIFALERDPKGEAVDFAPDGYSGDLGFYFRVGPRYVQIIASDQNPKTRELALHLAKNRATTLPADDSGLAARRRLPAEGLVADSVRFVPENAQGQAFFKEVFEASYDFSGAKLPFFIMVAQPAEAAAAFDSFQTFCGKFGGKVKPLPETGGARVFQAENFGTWKTIFQRGGEIGGVFDAADPAKSLQFVERYLQQDKP